MIPPQLSLPDSIRRQIESTGARIRLGYPRWLRLLLQRDVIGITLGRTVFVSASLETKRTELESLLRHELVHVGQIARLGLIRFYVSYIAEYVRNRRRGFSSADAYRQISFEIEAYAAERGETPDQPA